MQKNADTARPTLLDIFSNKNIFTTRSIAVMGLMVACAAVLSRFATIYITPVQRITFAYIPGVAVAVLYGPLAALTFGFVSDFVKYLSNPMGGYFPGYAISDMLQYFIYACFFYKRPYRFAPSLVRAFASRLIVVVVVFLGLNYVWTIMLSGTAAAAFFTGARLIINMAALPLHALVITGTVKLIYRVVPGYGVRG